MLLVTVVEVLVDLAACKVDELRPCILEVYCATRNRCTCVERLESWCTWSSKGHERKGCSPTRYVQGMRLVLEEVAVGQFSLECIEFCISNVSRGQFFTVRPTQGYVC